MFKRALVASWMPGRGALPKRLRLSFRAFTAADCDAVSLGIAVLLTPSDWEATPAKFWSITLEAFSECPVIGATDELGFPVVDGWETGKRLRHLKILEKGERIGLWRGVDFRLRFLRKRYCPQCPGGTAHGPPGASNIAKQERGDRVLILGQADGELPWQKLAT